MTLSTGRVDFVAQRTCIIAGKRFASGSTIHVQFKDNESARLFEENQIGEGGPWGYGGYTSRDILAFAESIEDERGEEIWRLK